MDKRAALCVPLTLLLSAAPALGDTPPEADTPAVPGELVVDLHDRTTDAEAAALARRYDAALVPVSDYTQKDRVYRLKVRAGESDRKGVLSRLLESLRREPSVEAADLGLLYEIPETARGALTGAAEQALPVADHDRADSGFPNDPKYRYQWHLGQIRMPRAWALGQGAGVTVAVIDTGVTRVEDLAGVEFVPGWNFVDNNDDARDDHGHGTHVAGTIAQATNNGLGVAGVAYKARIMPIKVLSAQGSGSVGGIAEGIRWATDHGARVINMSLGGRLNSQVLAKAVLYAYERGVVVVCAAGNNGQGKVSYPAANRGALAVAATQFDEATTFYSNWGREIAVAAPGGNTRLDQNGDGVPDGVLQNTVVPGDTARQDYLLFMGTSMASPHVAGVAALLVGAGVKDPQEVRHILERTARRPAQYRGSHDEHYGAGIVDAEAALQEARARGRGTSEGAFALGLVLLSLGGLALRRGCRGGPLPL